MENEVSGKGKSTLEFLPLNVKLLSKITPMLCECPYMLCDYTPGGLLFGMKRLYSTEVCVADGRVFLSVISDDRMRREFIMPTGELSSSVEMLYE